VTRHPQTPVFAILHDLTAPVRAESRWFVQKLMETR
jgi:hypothetical protein